jgi:hypothetical protein
VVQRTGGNRDGYSGERIEIDAVLTDVDAFARETGWTCDRLAVGEGVRLQMWRRKGRVGGKRVYVSAGIHGDEPAGPLAIRQLFQENRWREDVDFWVCPCLNPTGFARGTRANAQGVDLNRQYLHLQAAETVAHVRWLRQQPGFEVALCLHEDWESQGFYLYELNPDGLRSYADEINRRVAEVCPIDGSPIIEGRPAERGIIRPSSDPRSRPEWPEAFWLLSHKTRLSYTLEAPSDYPLATRVGALVTGVQVVIEVI